MTVDGLFNARTLPLPIRTNYAYRSATLELLTDLGKQKIIAIGIKTILDLRSRKEMESYPDPEIEGVEVLWKPSTPKNDTTIPANHPDRKEFTVCPSRHMQSCLTYQVLDCRDVSWLPGDTQSELQVCD